MAKKTNPNEPITNSEARRQAFDLALKHVQSSHGEESIRKLGDVTNVKKDSYPSGSIQLDRALGIGGYPKGRIIEIYGPESSGKTTLTLELIASVQKRGGNCVFIDAEHALDPTYAQNIGVDVDRLAVSQPNSGEDALDIADTMIRSGGVDLIVIDSVAALTPKAELEGEMSDANVGLQARMMSKALRKITASSQQNGTTVVFINQLREKIGVFFGSPETTTGGKALKFYASVRLDIRRIETLKEGTNSVGNKTRVKVVKNKVAPPFKEAVFSIYYGTGISLEAELIELGVEFGFVKKSGSWFTDAEDGSQIGQGTNNARQFLLDNPGYAAELEEKIRAVVFPPAEAIAEPDSVDEDA